MARRLTPLLVASAAMLAVAGCGGSSSSTNNAASNPAAYLAKGDHPPRTGPPITVETAQAAIESRGIDLYMEHSHLDLSALHPLPVEAQRFATADSSFFFLLVFDDARTAHAALRSANHAVAKPARIVQAGNVIVVTTKSGDFGMTTAVPPILRRLAAQVRHNPPPATSTFLNGSGPAAPAHASAPPPYVRTTAPSDAPGGPGGGG